jgi:hypothetical protein
MGSVCHVRDSMYYIDSSGDICYKSSIDRCYFCLASKDGSLFWVQHCDWREYSKEDRDRFKKTQISEKYLLLRGIPLISLDNGL